MYWTNNGLKSSLASVSRQSLSPAPNSLPPRFPSVWFRPSASCWRRLCREPAIWGIVLAIKTAPESLVRVERWWITPKNVAARNHRCGSRGWQAAGGSPLENGRVMMTVFFGQTDHRAQKAPRRAPAHPPMRPHGAKAPDTERHTSGALRGCCARNRHEPKGTGSLFG